MVLDEGKFDVWIVSPVSKCPDWCISACICFSLSSSCNPDWEDPEQSLLSMNPSLAILSTPRGKAEEGKSACCSQRDAAPCTKPEWALIRPHFSGQTLLLLPLLMFRLTPRKAQRGPAQACGWHVMKTNQIFLNMQRSEQFSPVVPVDGKVSRETTAKQQLPMTKTYQNQPRQVRQLWEGRPWLHYFWRVQKEKGWLILLTIKPFDHTAICPQLNR